MSITRTVAVASAILVSSNVVTRLASLLSFLMLVRVLSVDQYGLLVLSFTTATPLNVLTGFGVEDTVTADVSSRLGAGHVGRARALLFDYLGVRLVGTLIFVAIGAAVAPSILPWLAPSYMPVLTAIVPALVAFLVANAMRGSQAMIFQVGQRYAAMGVADMTESLFRAAAVAWFFFAGWLNLETALFIYAGSKIVAILATGKSWMSVLIMLRRTPAEACAGLATLLRTYGKWDVIRSSFGQLSTRLDVWFLGLFVNAASVGQLALAQNVISTAFSFFPLSRIFTPLSASHAGDHWLLERLAQRASKYGILFYGAVALVLVLVMPPAVRLFFPAYQSSIAYVFALLPRTLLQPVGMAQATLLTVFHEQRLVFFLSNIGIASSMTLLPLLVWQFGVWGVIIEYIFTTLVVYLLREIRLRRHHRIATVRFATLVRLDDYDRSLLQRIRSILTTFLKYFR